MNASGTNDSQELTTSLTDNIALIKSIFKNDSTLMARRLQTRSEPIIKYCMFFSDGMVNNKLLNEDVIRPLLEYQPSQKEPDLMEIIATQITLSDTVDKVTEMDKIIQAIIYGDTVLLADGHAQALILNTKGWSLRSIQEPENEKVLKGPREGFTEALLINLSMIRRKLRTPNLKMEYLTFGRESKTQTCICYVEGIVNVKVLDELKQRLKKVDIDGVMDANYISELIKDHPQSIIETIGSTERVDVVAAQILEGRVALFVDGTPVVLTMPYLFIEYFQNDEDYYTNYAFGSVNRILRMISFIFSTCVPAIYIAVVNFHQEILPTTLIISISIARQGVPFPTVVEAFLMLIVFEMLRESGSRMPGTMGTALSIVGALVIGQAAVQAKLVSAPMIIVVSVTGIAGLMIPHAKGVTVPLRFTFLALASVMGLYGLMFGLLALLSYLFSMTSFGMPIMNSVFSDTPQDVKDISIRTPWGNMITRPRGFSRNRVRNVTKGGSK